MTLSPKVMRFDSHIVIDPVKIAVNLALLLTLALRRVTSVFLPIFVVILVNIIAWRDQPLMHVQNDTFICSHHYHFREKTLFVNIGYFVIYCCQKVNQLLQWG